MRISEVIKTKRKELNLTQEQIGGFLGVSTPAVNKWEKGTSYPDVTLLPALARILRIDLNTLFSYEKEMSEQEIGIFLNEVYDILEKEGVEKAYETAMDKVREFPTCALLLNSVAAFLDGIVILYAKEKQDIYMEEIEKLYERAVQYGEQQTRDTAKYMLIVRCLRRADYEKAKQLWETLPEQKIDKNALEATICMHEKEYDQAVVILEKQLWRKVNDVQNALSHLKVCYEETGQKEKSELCLIKIESLADTFDLWDYVKYVAKFQRAVLNRDKGETLKALEALLKSAKQPYYLQEKPLFSNIPKKNDADGNSNSGGALKQMVAMLISSIREDNGVDGKGFLQGDEDLAELLEEYD